jgi:DNA/RNA endonuclease YhcR with UshA esterase domain
MSTGGLVMRQLALLIFVLSPVLVTADGPDKPITPAEAAKKINEKVTVEFRVKSVGGVTNGYLNSETDYKDAKNFTVFLPKETIEKFKEMKINDPRAHFKDKTIQVSGTVMLYRDKPQINVEAPDQIKIVEKQ